MPIQEYDIFRYQYAAINCAYMMSDDQYETINFVDGTVRQR